MLYEVHSPYPYIAIFRATLRVLLEVRISQSAKNDQGFMQRIKELAPFALITVLADNDKSFIDCLPWVVTSTKRVRHSGVTKPCHRASLDLAKQASD